MRKNQFSCQPRSRARLKSISAGNFAASARQIGGPSLETVNSRHRPTKSPASSLLITGIIRNNADSDSQFVDGLILRVNGRVRVTPAARWMHPSSRHRVISQSRCKRSTDISLTLNFASIHKIFERNSLVPLRTRHSSSNFKNTTAVSSENLTLHMKTHVHPLYSHKSRKSPSAKLPCTKNG